MVQSPTRMTPFPGLRPFELDEDYLFFGREGQSDALLTRLSRTRFLAVVGTSGSGKSSLVRAGLLPSLYSGFLAEATSTWRVAVLRPGGGPMRNLAAALNDPNVFGIAPSSPRQTDEAIIRTALTESTLRRGAPGLVEVTEQARMEPRESLLVVVDQFEELFRFQQRARGDEQTLAAEDEASAFVKLLLTAVGQRRIPIFVVLTMRSDFLGDCAQFRDLPEALNDSQYLIPRLTRTQLRRAIEGPVAVGGATITPRLVNRLLNDVGENPDQLPILQHALMRTWDYWTDQGTPGDPIDLIHYQATGGMAQALSRHADQIYEALPDDRTRQSAERLFKRLTDRGADNREIRRPTPLAELCVVTAASPEDVVAVIDEFRAPRRSFLMPPAGVPLRDETVVDISHESLMRNWQRLTGWVAEEAESASIYRRLAETAALHSQGKASYLRDPELANGLNWQAEEQPNVAWAERYAANFGEATAFLLASAKAQVKETAQKEQARRKEVRRLRSFLAVLTGLSLLTTGVSIFAFNQQNRARNQEINAEIRTESLTVENLMANNLNISAMQKALVLGRRIKAIEKTTFLADGPQSAPQPQNAKAWLNSALQPSVRRQAISSLREFYYLDGFLFKNSLEGHSGSVLSVSFAPDGETVASASDDGTVKLWDRSGRELQTLEGHSGSVLSVSFAPDGNTLATASGDGTVILWNFDLDNLMAKTCHWLRDYMTNPATSEPDKALCEGVPTPQQLSSRLSSPPIQSPLLGALHGLADVRGWFEG
ncbi:MAG: hypothetical protein AAFZ80_12820 [Cyanobacteria bacterium P01_A01_bin.105]